MDSPARPRLSQLQVMADPATEFAAGVRDDTSKVSREPGERAFQHVVAEVAQLLGRTEREGREW